MATTPRIEAVLTQLRATDLSAVFDGPATDTPAGPYACVYDDPGFGRATRYAQNGGATHVDWTIRVVCCGRSRDGMREAVNEVRAALEEFYPDPDPGAGWLTQISAGPMLPDGPAGDTRFSQTLTYQHSTSRH